MKYDIKKQYKKGKTANYLFSSSVINSTVNYNHILNQTGTPRNDRSIICKRPSQLYQNQTQLITPKVNLRSINSTDKPLFSSLSIHKNNNSNISHKEVFCFEDDVQQLNIASEESDQLTAIEPLTIDSNKGFEKNTIVCDSTAISPVQIKKILIENYRNDKNKETDMNILNPEDNKTLSSLYNNNDNYMHQPSFSLISRSPKNLEEDNNSNLNMNNNNSSSNINSNVNINNNNCNANTNTNTINNKNNITIVSGNKDQQEYQINHSNFFFNIPSINIIYKSQDNKHRAKSNAPDQRNYFNFEKIKHSNSNSNNNSNDINHIMNKYNKGNSSKQVTYQKRIKSFGDKLSQKDTLSSRIKPKSSSKSKDNSCLSTGVKQSVKPNYPIVSEINKKLFNDMNATFNKKYYNRSTNFGNKTNNTNTSNVKNDTHHHTQNINHQKQLKSIEPIKRKEYLNIVENLDDTDFSKIIQIIDKISVDPMLNTMKERKSITKDIIYQSNNNNSKENNNNNSTTNKEVSSIKRLSLTTIVKNAASSAVNKQYPNSKEIRVNYIRTDSMSQSANASKTSIAKHSQPNYSVLSLNILSNWGSTIKVGVTEIQLFDSKGKIIPISKCHVFNGSEDNINRIINKKTHTINDNDMWSTPFSSNIKIEVYFDSSTYDVSSVNIWNYNGKDLQRGIKEIELSRKNVLCWKGIVPKGCFNIKTNYSLKIKLSSSLNSSKTNANTTLAKQREDNSLYQSIPKEYYDSFQLINNNDYDTQTPSRTIINKMKISDIDITSNNASSSSARKRTFNNDNYNMNNKTEEDTKLLSPITKLSFKECAYQSFISFSKIRIQFKESYGNKSYIGLTGIKFVDKNDNVYSVDTAISVGALPKDVSSECNGDDPQIFENVFNNINDTIDNSNMWLTVFKNPYIEICYETQQTLSQLLIWNYNDPESLDKCTKVIEITFDDNPSTTSEILLMKGIGLNKGDYSQSITFPYTLPLYNSTMLNPPTSDLNELNYNENDYVYPLLPSSFWFKFVLLSNYGDPNLIGLNAIEFFDPEGNMMTPLKIINDPEMKLTQGHSSDINKYWMTSYCNANRVDNMIDRSMFVVIFDKIVRVSHIKLYNIIREPKQGVKSFQIICDDNIIFEGEMKKAKCLNENCVVFVANHNNKNMDIKKETIIGSSLNKEDNKNKYQIRKSKNGFAMTLKGQN